MKTVTILMCLLAMVSLAGCSTVSVWDEDDDAIGVRLGKYLTENNEVGISTKWQDDDSEPRGFGIYAVHHFPEQVEFRNPLIVDFLPETIFGTAYLGGKMDYDLDTHDSETSPIAGVIFEETLFIESSLDGDTMFGIRFKF